MVICIDVKTYMAERADLVVLLCTDAGTHSKVLTGKLVYHPLCRSLRQRCPQSELYVIRHASTIALMDCDWLPDMLSIVVRVVWKAISRRLLTQVHAYRAA
jgi:hypothetical protein